MTERPAIPEPAVNCILDRADAGTGYTVAVDLERGEVRDAFGLRESFTIDAPEAGTYQLTVRYVNGGATDRPMTLTVDGVTQTLAFASTAPAASSGTCITSRRSWAPSTR